MLHDNGGAQVWARERLTRPDLLPHPVRTVNMNRLGELLADADPPVMAMVVYNSNPAAVAPEQNKVLRGLAREDLFLVVHELFMTDTARFADVVFPATTQFEQWDVHSSYWHLYMQVNRPVIAPVGEGKPNYEFFALLAKKMGKTRQIIALDPTEKTFDEAFPDLNRKAINE